MTEYTHCNVEDQRLGGEALSDITGPIRESPSRQAQGGTVEVQRSLVE